MKTSIIGWLGVVIACAALAACGGNSHIAEVKALPFSYPSNNVQDPNMTVDQALDYRKICDSVKWKVDQTEQHQTFVEYTCTYKGVKDSMFMAKSKWQHPTNIAADTIGDVYQWVYGADGKPQLSYVAMQVHFANGTAKDLTQSETMNGMYIDGAPWMTALMKEAVNNTAEDYDHLTSELYGIRIPPPVADLVAQAAAIKAKEDARLLDNCLQPWTRNYDAQQTALGKNDSVSQDQLKEWEGWCKEGKQAPAIPADDWTEVGNTHVLAGQVKGNGTATTGVDRELFKLPTFIGKEDPQMYPIYAVTCQFDKQVCESTDAENNPIQLSVQAVAAKLNYLNNSDILSGKYTCRFTICSNSDGAIVGRASDAMVKFIPDLGQ